MSFILIYSGRGCSQQSTSSASAYHLTVPNGNSFDPGCAPFHSPSQHPQHYQRSVMLSASSSVDSSTQLLRGDEVLSSRHAHASATSPYAVDTTGTLEDDVENEDHSTGLMLDESLAHSLPTPPRRRTVSVSVKESIGGGGKIKVPSDLLSDTNSFL